MSGDILNTKYYINTLHYYICNWLTHSMIKHTISRAALATKNKQWPGPSVQVTGPLSAVKWLQLSEHWNFTIPACNTLTTSVEALGSRHRGQAGRE